jgi:hypothetical protein
MPFKGQKPLTWLVKYLSFSNGQLQSLAIFLPTQTKLLTMRLFHPLNSLVVTRNLWLILLNKI